MKGKIFINLSGALGCIHTYQSLLSASMHLKPTEKRNTGGCWLENSILLFGFLPVWLIALISRTGKMDFELLIIEYEKRPAIWDPRDPKHCNRDFFD